jgi:hypothetical protein
MDRTKWIVRTLLVVSLVMVTVSQAAAEVYTIHWANMLAAENVTWNNNDAYCDVSIDWINLVGAVQQNFPMQPALKAYPYSERRRDQTVTIPASLCKTLRLNAICQEKPSPQWSHQMTRNYSKDVTPCAGGTAEIQPYSIGIVWNPKPYVDPGQ